MRFSLILLIDDFEIFNAYEANMLSLIQILCDLSIIIINYVITILRFMLRLMFMLDMSLNIRSRFLIVRLLIFYVIILIQSLRLI